MNIAVIGHGWVGGTVTRWFEKQGRRVIVYDPPKALHGDLNEADVCFVCVPTPFGPNGFDDSYVRAAVANIPGNKIVVIKSTVLPGTTERIQADNQRHALLFNPEFLRERACDEDFANPDRQIVGSPAKGFYAAEKLLEILPPAPHSMVVPIREAETIKYFGNCYLAMRVTFANQIYDLCKAIGADYETVKSAAEQDKRIGPGYFNVDCDGYRGYGGTCFPKDMRALIQLGDKVGAPMELLRACEGINNALRAPKAVNE
jgi:UDPglucose 6-dehydrogenase